MRKKAKVKRTEKEQVYRLYYTCPHCGKEHSFRMNSVEATYIDVACPNNKDNRIKLINRRK